MGLYAAPLCLLLLSVAAQPSVYLKLRPNVPNCFHNDVASGILTQISYRLEPFADKMKRKPEYQKELSIKVVIFDPENEVQLSRVYRGEGQVYYTSARSGIHKACIEPLFPDSRGVNTMLNLRHTQDQVRLIISRQRYADARERRFRQTTDAISQKVLLFGMLHVLALLAVGYCQLKSLRNFFMAKKLV
ncbi:hypothetical protein SprV_0100127800 [Sparganum proliferum]